jgi:streptomycin 6-kinase
MNQFEGNILRIHKDQGKDWLSSLPQIVAQAVEQYDLHDLTPVNNMSYNYVLSGFQKKQPIILKLGMDVEGLKREAATLKAFAGFGAVQVLEKSDGLLLLERAIPGLTLKTCPSSLEAIAITCELMKKLHQAPIPQDVSFPHMKNWLAVLDQDWDIPIIYLEKARQFRDYLMPLYRETVLLHGDLHNENILQNGDEWLAIDPKGIIGSPIHEIWTSIRDIEQDTGYAAQFFNFDIMAVRQWYFVHLIKAAVWNIEDGASPQPFLGLAEKAYAIINKEEK